MNHQLYNLIFAAQQGSESDLLCLLEKFQPLLKKSASSLSASHLVDQEDAYADLQIEFILLIRRINLKKLTCTDDGVLVSYIKLSIDRVKSSYFQTLARGNAMVCWDDLSPAESRKAEYQNSQKDTHKTLLFEDMKKILSPKEYTVICEFYIQDKTIEEIAACFGVSRQALNKTKLRALEKLRKAF